MGLSRGGSSEQHGAGGTRGGLGADVKSEQAAKAEVESGAGSNQRRRRHITCGHASKALWDIKMCMFLNNLSLRLKCSKAFHFQRSRFFLKPCVIFPQRIVVISHSTKVLSPFDAGVHQRFPRKWCN